jgi:anti-sigma B factor antagonist
MVETSSVGGNRPPLTLESSRPVPGLLVVHVGGELDLLTAPVLEQYLRDETADGTAQLAVDLSRVTFVGSHGCALLGDAVGTGRGVRGELSLVGATHRPVARALQLAGLEQVIPTYPELADLLAHLAGTR